MRTIKKGQSGNTVACLQDYLAKYGLPTGEKGVFDDTTHQSLVKFQQEHKLDADGVAGYRTWEALLFCCQAPGGEKLTDEDFDLVANLLDCEAAALKAVQQVETGGRGGFFAPGKPAILFEGHIFWNQLKKRGIDPAAQMRGNEDVLYPRWEKGHYKGGMGEYDRLEQARKIHREAADSSASWGMFQIMGFNYAACDEPDVNTFVSHMADSERMQLVLSARFIRKAGMLPFLQGKDWAEFAKRYNGPAYAQNEYDKKLASAYLKLKAGV